MSGWLSTPIFTTLERGIDASATRQRVLSNNIANVDTPDFKRSDVNFDKVLSQALGESTTVEKLALKTTSSKHLPRRDHSNPSIITEDKNSTMRNDGNNVDIEKEMVNVVENNIYYNSLTKALSSQLTNLRTVVSQK